MALHLAVQLQNQIGEGFVVAPLAHGIGEKAKIRVVLNPVVAVLQHPVEAGGLHGIGPLLVEDLEVRRQPRRLAVFPKEIRAEAVDGADLRTADQGALAAQTGITGIVRKTARQLLHDPAAQLPRRCAGKGDDEEAVHVRGRIGIGDVCHQPLGQHLGLAAARSGGHQYRTAARFDRFPL